MIKPAEALYREYKKYKNPKPIRDPVYGGTYPESNLFASFFALWCLCTLLIAGALIGLFFILLASPIVFGSLVLGFAIVFGVPTIVVLRGKHKEAKAE